MSGCYTFSLFCDVCGWWEPDHAQTFKLPQQRTRAVKDSVEAHTTLGWSVSKTGKVALCPSHTGKKVDDGSKR